MHDVLRGIRFRVRQKKSFKGEKWGQKSFPRLDDFFCLTRMWIVSTKNMHYTYMFQNVLFLKKMLIMDTISVILTHC